jgi:predicted ferric reductase
MKEQYKKVVLLVLLALFIGLPAVFVPLPAPLISDGGSLTSYLAALTGYIGFGMLVMMFVLGSRSAVGMYIRDMPWVLKVHSWLGKYGFVVVFSHPLFMVLKYSFTSMFLIISLETQFDQALVFGRTALFLLLIVWITSAIVRKKIAYRPWKYIHYLVYITLPFLVLHIRSGSNFSLEAARVYWYISTMILLVFVCLRMRHLFGYGKIRALVHSIRHVEESVVELQLQIPDGLQVKKGQYVYLTLSLLSEEHPFSVVGINGELLAVTFKTFGPYTRKLAQLRAGDHVYVDGPYGVFTSSITKNQDVVFIAGGIGITPFVSHILSRDPSKTWLLYANRIKKSAVYRSELTRALSSNYVDVLSAETEPPVEWGDERGFISFNIIKKYVPDVQNKSFYICGPPIMMKQVKKALLQNGVSQSSIHTEEFSL